MSEREDLAAQIQRLFDQDTDFETLRAFIAKGGASPKAPDADDALERIQTHVEALEGTVAWYWETFGAGETTETATARDSRIEALEGALRSIVRDVPEDEDAANIARAALAGEPESV